MTCIQPSFWLSVHSIFSSPFHPLRILSLLFQTKTLGDGETSDDAGNSYGPQHNESTVESVAGSSDNDHTTGTPTDSNAHGSERPDSQSKSASPPVVSSTTTTATTPPSSPRTGTASTLSSPDLKAPVSPRATLRAAAAAKAVGTTPKDTIHRSADAKVSDTAGSASSAAEIDRDSNVLLEQVPPGVVQQYSAKSEAGLTSADSLVSLKMLVSNNVAGSIIGRSGQSISELQSQSSSRIKLSQAGDFYPGTSDRVCLIQGDQTQVKSAISLIIKRIDELQRQAEQRGQQQRQQEENDDEDHFTDAPPTEDGDGEDGDDDETLSSQSFIIRILVPTPACGMIIGRGGSNIKNMAELSGVSSIRLSPKEYSEHPTQRAHQHHHFHHNRQQQQHPDASGSTATVTNERIVTISGPSLSSIALCVNLIIDDIATHPEIGRYANMTTSYSRASSTFLSTSSPGLDPTSTNRPTSGPFYAPAGPYATRPAPAPAHIASSMPAGTAPNNMIMSPPSPMIQGHLHRLYGGDASAHGEMDSLGSSQHQQPIHYHSPHHSQHVHTPSSAASHHHHMYPGTPAAPIPTLNQPNYVPLSPQHMQPSDHQAAFPQAENRQLRSSMYSPVGGQSGSNLSSRHSQEEIRLSLPSQAASSSVSVQVGGMTPMPATSPGSESTNGYVQEAPISQPGGSLIQMSIPDSLIGAILGRGGSTLNDLQTSTSTRIRISQRGVYVPGTTNRVVTISGPTAESVATAQYLINQRLAKSNTERARQQEAHTDTRNTSMNDADQGKRGGQHGKKP